MLVKSILLVTVIHFISAAPNGEFCSLLPLWVCMYNICFTTCRSQYIAFSTCRSLSKWSGALLYHCWSMSDFHMPNLPVRLLVSCSWKWLICLHNTCHIHIILVLILHAPCNTMSNHHTKSFALSYILSRKVLQMWPLIFDFSPVSVKSATFAFIYTFQEFLFFCNLHVYTYIVDMKYKSSQALWH